MTIEKQEKNKEILVQRLGWRTTDNVTLFHYPLIREFEAYIKTIFSEGKLGSAVAVV